MHYPICYFFDQMQFYELNLILKYYNYRFKFDLEIMRNQSYIIAQCNSTKRLNKEDIFKFEWDQKEEIKQQNKVELSKEDIELYRRKAQEIIRKNFTFK